MDFFGSERFGEAMPFDRMIAEGVQTCPFLRNIGESTNFSFSIPARFPTPVKGNHGPIFEDGPNFELAFNLFHGRTGVVPLSRQSQMAGNDVKSEVRSVKFHPLAASAATISLSALGPSGPFGFDSFMSKIKNMKGKNKLEKKEQQSEKKPSSSDHEAWSNEWLQTGNCPIAKSFRAVSGVLPLVAKILQPPPGIKLQCPPAVAAARAALARTAAVKSLRPQPLPTRVLAVGMLGMALNVPLGIWREHTEKFSPAWFTAVHASVPFIAMLRKAVHMPKYAMAFTFAASILGQVIGSRAERRRIELTSLRSVEDASKGGAETLGDSWPCPAVGDCESVSEEVSVEKIKSPCSLQCGKEAGSFSVKPSPSPDALRAF